MTFSGLAFALSLAVTIYTWRDDLKPYFFMLLHLLIGTCYALTFTKDLFNAYVLFEIITLASFLLVGYERQPRQIWASLRYLILSSFGMGLFLLGVAVAYHHGHTLDLTQLAPFVAQHAGEPWVALAGALMFAGVSVKAGVFSFSLWLPAAHSRAMPPVSALLSGLVIKMGVVELFRLSDVFPLGLPLIVLGVATALLGILYAIRSYDLKRMLAFHTVSQIGYLLVGFGVGTTAARLGALDYAVAHGLFKALLFLAIGEMAAVAGSSRLPALVAVRDRLPRSARWALVVGTLGIIGMPPFAGFAAKAVLESGVHSVGMHAVVALFAVGTTASFAKMTPLLFGSCCGASPTYRSIAYAWLSAAIILFLPVSRAMAPRPIWAATLAWPAYLESGTAVALGALLYIGLRRRGFRLPERIFHLEEAVLVILVGFLVVWSLLTFA